MIPTRRFILWWVLVTTPIELAGILLLPPFIAWIGTEVFRGGALRYWLVMGGFSLISTAAAGFAQSALLAKGRRPARLWALAAVAGHAVALTMNYSLWSQLGAMSVGLGQGPVFWIFQALSVGSFALTIAIARALSLWGRRWAPVWPLWLAGSVGISVGLWILSVVLNLAVMGNQPSAWLSTAETVAFLAGSAAGTAWLLDRLVFPAAILAR